MTMIRKGLVASSAMVLMLSATQALAQDAKRMQARALSATCANCHGSEGRPPRNSSLPPLAGMPAVVFLEKMKGFKGEAAGVTVMHQIAKGFSEAQIEQMATYFAAQK